MLLDVLDGAPAPEVLYFALHALRNLAVDGARPRLGAPRRARRMMCVCWGGGGHPTGGACRAKLRTYRS